MTSCLRFASTFVCTDHMPSDIFVIPVTCNMCDYLTMLVHAFLLAATPGCETPRFKELRARGRGSEVSPGVFYGSSAGKPAHRPPQLIRLLTEIQNDLVLQKTPITRYFPLHVFAGQREFLYNLSSSICHEILGNFWISRTSCNRCHITVVVHCFDFLPGKLSGKLFLSKSKQSNLLTVMETRALQCFSIRTIWMGNGGSWPPPMTNSGTGSV